jgi:hypothetical protein
MATTIPAVRDAVVAVLAAAEALEGITIADGLEPTSQKQYVWLWKAKAKRNFSGVGAGRPLPQDEDVSLTMRVVVIGTEDPRARAFEIADLVEAALAADARLGGAVKWHRIEELDEEPLQFDQKPGHHVLMTLSARARI